MEKGSLWIAQTSDRLHTLKRQYAIIKAFGIHCEILTIDKIKEKLPILDPQGVWVRKIVSYSINIVFLFSKGWSLDTK